MEVNNNADISKLYETILIYLKRDNDKKLFIM